MFKKILKFIFITFFIILMGLISAFDYNKKESKKNLENKNIISTQDKAIEELQEEKILLREIQKEKEELKKKEEDYFANLEKEITNKISIYGDSIGLCYYDIDTNRSISINGDNYFFAASTTKVPLNMVLCDKVFNGEISLNDSMYYNNIYYEAGTGIIQNDIKSSYTLQELFDYSIKYSDNIATNMLYSYLGGYNHVMTEFDKYLGYKANHFPNNITPVQATTYLKTLYENQNNNPYYEKLIDNLKNTQFKNRMEKNLTNLVAHKIGTYGYSINDIGIVYAKNPFILCIYTNNINNAENLITEITDLIFSKQN